MASNGKGKAKGGHDKETVSVGEHTTPVHAPLIHISGYTQCFTNIAVILITCNQLQNNYFVSNVIYTYIV